MSATTVILAHSFLMVVAGWFLRDAVMWIKIAFRGEYHCQHCGHRQALPGDNDE